MIADNVLDKKRLRTIYASVGGLFATLVPIMISFNTGAGQGLTYAAFPHSPTVYAFNSMTRTYDDSLAYCESLWMFPATLDPSRISDEEIQAIMDVMVGLGNQIFAGAKKNEVGDYEWADGTPWTRRTDDIEANPNEDYLYLALTETGQPPAWRDTSGAKGALCQGEISNIRGAIPTILNLKRSAPPQRQACDLTRDHVDAFRNVAAALNLNASCVYNATLSGILEGSI